MCGLILTIYVLYDVFFCAGSCLLRVAMIVPVL